MAVLWLVARPSQVPVGTYVGQFLGAESVLLLSIALVLISTLPLVEEWFDGIDRAAIWHRRAAITGVLLLVPHIFLAKSQQGTRFGVPLGAIGMIGRIGLAVWAILPRWRSVVPCPLRVVVRTLRDAPGVREVRLVFGGYERWLLLHRTTGLFVAAGFLHGVLDGTPFHHSLVLRWSYVAVGAVGVAFYVYREFLARFFVSLHDYEVEESARWTTRWSRCRCARSAAISSSFPASSRWCTSRRRTAGIGTRSRSRARRTRTSSESP